MGEQEVRKFYETEIIKSLNQIENLDIINYLYQFIKEAATRWK